MAVNLRPYQQEAVNAIFGYLRSKRGNPLVALPTGSGKSHVQAGFIQQALAGWPQTRIMCLTHRKELIVQNAEKAQLYLGQRVGIYSAGLGQRDIRSVTFAGIQSIYNKDIQPPNLIIIDECHLVPKSGNGMYLKFLKRLKEENPKLRVIGMSATPYRLQGGMLTHGKGKIFNSVVYNLPIQRLIDEGVLAPVVSAKTSTEIKTDGVNIQAGEYNLKELDAAASMKHVTAGAVNDAIKHGVNRKSWLIFCVSVAHAKHVSAAFRMMGMASECVTGETPGDERDRILRDYKAGRVKVLTNCNVLTTGFDAPFTDMIILLRPTVSPGLYVQMIGRGMRPADGKDDCLVLDYGGNISRHGPIDNVRMPVQGEGGGEAPVKFCPICLAECHAAKRMCPECGHIFEMTGPQIGKRASKLSILESQKRTEEHEITNVYYHQHVGKESGKRTLRVDYYQKSLRVASEWVCIEHRDFARHKAEKWWVRRDKYIESSKDVPKTIDHALELTDDLLIPAAIKTRQEGKYTKVVGYAF